MRHYLKFNELDDYLAHLRNATKEESPLTYVDMATVAGKPDQHGIFGIAYYAVLTRRLGDYIAKTTIPLLHTTNFHLRVEQEKMREKLHKNFDDVLETLRQRGIIVERGQWALGDEEDGTK